MYDLSNQGNAVGAIDRLTSAGRTLFAALTETQAPGDPGRESNQAVTECLTSKSVEQLAREYHQQGHLVGSRRNGRVRLWAALVHLFARTLAEEEGQATAVD